MLVLAPTAGAAVKASAALQRSGDAFVLQVKVTSTKAFTASTRPRSVKVGSLSLKRTRPARKAVTFKSKATLRREGDEPRRHATRRSASRRARAPRRSAPRSPALRRRRPPARLRPRPRRPRRARRRPRSPTRPATTPRARPRCRGRSPARVGLVRLQRPDRRVPPPVVPVRRHVPAQHDRLERRLGRDLPPVRRRHLDVQGGLDASDAGGGLVLVKVGLTTHAGRGATRS